MAIQNFTEKQLLKKLFSSLEAHYRNDKLTPSEKAHFGTFICMKEIYKLMDKTHLDAMMVTYEIKDIERIKTEVAIQTEMFADEFQKGVRNMFKKLD